MDHSGTALNIFEAQLFLVHLAYLDYTGGRLFSEELLGGHNQFGLDSALFLAPKLNLFTLTSVAQVFAKILILSDALVRSTYVELVP